jgi:hypothetical protein
LRALGPGSVSSLLKTALDVAYVILWITAVGVLLGLVASLVLAPFMNQLGDEATVTINSRTYRDLTRYSPLIATALTSLLIYLAGLVAIVGRLRQVFATLIAGDPFQPENVIRLRFIGAVLAGLLILGYAAPALMAVLFPDALDDDFNLSFNPTSWFAVLVVFVLAEVFREGARLRGEAELTI